MARFDRLGLVLSMLRMKRGESQKTLARRAGLTASMVSCFEKGTKKPSLDSLGRLLDALGVELGELDRALEETSWLEEAVKPRGGR